MGDSLMAVFGVPVAHDDDAERAVAAGLAMRRLGGDLVFSIGINSGAVMATPVGEGGDSTVIGDTVNVAARLEKAAGPGEVWCGPLTAELIGSRAVFRARQPVILKGKREPVEVWEAVALRPSDASQPGDAMPMLGREEDLAYLESLWRRVHRDGEAQVALLCGEAGSGKTRLVRELARRTQPEGSLIWATYPAYGPVGGPRVAAEVLRQLGSAGDEDVMARVRSLVGPAEQSLQAIDPTGLQQEQLWALARLLEEKSADRPLLIVIDDMHRSTETTLDILVGLSARLGRAPLLLLLVGRSDPGDWLGRLPSARTVRLAPLAPKDAADLAAALVCEKPLAEEAINFLVERAGGNPLYMRELIAMARAQGSLVDDGDCYRLGSAASVPASLQAVLAARLDALSPTAKLLFQHTAILGDGSTADQIFALGRGDRESMFARPGGRWAPAPQSRRRLRGHRSADARGGVRDPPPQRQRRLAPAGSQIGQPARRPGPPPRAGGRVHPRRRLRCDGGGRGAGRHGRTAGLPVPAGRCRPRARPGGRAGLPPALGVV